MAYGFSQVKGAVALMQMGKFQLALEKFRTMQPTRYGTPGAPDIMGILVTGRYVGIEAKLPGNVPTDEQIAWRGMFERMSGLYILAYSLDDVALGLRQAGVSV